MKIKYFSIIIIILMVSFSFANIVYSQSSSCDEYDKRLKEFQKEQRELTKELLKIKSTQKRLKVFAVKFTKLHLELQDIALTCLEEAMEKLFAKLSNKSKDMYAETAYNFFNEPYNSTKHKVNEDLFRKLKKYITQKFGGSKSLNLLTHGQWEKIENNDKRLLENAKEQNKANATNFYEQSVAESRENRRNTINALNKVANTIKGNSSSGNNNSSSKSSGSGSNKCFCFGVAIGSGSSYKKVCYSEGMGGRSACMQEKKRMGGSYSVKGNCNKTTNCR